MKHYDEFVETWKKLFPSEKVLTESDITNSNPDILEYGINQFVLHMDFKYRIIYISVHGYEKEFYMSEMEHLL